jgi:hypothetical protein
MVAGPRRVSTESVSKHEVNFWSLLSIFLIFVMCLDVARPVEVLLKRFVWRVVVVVLLRVCVGLVGRLVGLLRVLIKRWRRVVGVCVARVV